MIPSQDKKVFIFQGFAGHSEANGWNINKDPETPADNLMKQADWIRKGRGRKGDMADNHVKPKLYLQKQMLQWFSSPVK